MSAFDALDTNHDGVITRAEVAGMMGGGAVTYGAPAVSAGYGVGSTISGAGLTYGAPAATGYAGVTYGAPTVGMTYGAPTVGMTYAAEPITTQYIEQAPVVMQQQIQYVEQAPVIMQEPIQQTVVERKFHGELAYPGGLPDPDPLPETETEEHVIEVPTTLFVEKVVEIPKVHTTTLKKQKLAQRQVQKLVKEVVVPVTDVVVQEQVKQVHLYQDVEGEHKHQMIPVDLRREVPKEMVTQREKRVAVPELQYREKLVPVQATLTHEQIVEVPKVQIEELIKQVPKPELQTIQRTVERKVVQLEERQIPVPQTTVKESIVEVPQVEQAQLIKEMPRVRVEIIQKEVPRLEIQYREKLVEVPHIIYEEQIVEVPQIETREVVKQVAKTQVQFIDKRVPVKVPKYVEKIVEVPTIIHEERGILVPQMQQIEALTHMPKFQTQYVEKQIPVDKIMVQERTVHNELPLQVERAVEQPMVQTADYTVQVPVEQIEMVDKQVPRKQITAQEVMVEVPHILIQEELQLQPISQEVYLKRQRPEPRIKEFYKPIPKVEVQAVVKPRAKVVEVEEEVAVEVPQVRAVEIVQQRPAGKLKQRLIQTAEYHKESISRELAVAGEGHVRYGDRYDAVISGVQRVNPRDILTDMETTVVSQEMAQMFLQFEKYDDFLRPAMEWMHEQGEIIEPPLYTERYMRSLSPEALRQHAFKLYTMFGQDVTGSPVPDSDAALITWILQVQSKVFMLSREPQRGGVFYQGAMLTMKDQNALRAMSPFELREYANMLYATISARAGAIEPVPASDAALMQWILTTQQKYLGGAPTSIQQPRTIGTIGTAGTISGGVVRSIGGGAPIAYVGGGGVRSISGGAMAGGGMFDTLDTNHDGVITRGEFAAMMR